MTLLIDSTYSYDIGLELQIINEMMVYIVKYANMISNNAGEFTIIIDEIVLIRSDNLDFIKLFGGIVFLFVFSVYLSIVVVFSLFFFVFLFRYPFVWMIECIVNDSEPNRLKSVYNNFYFGILYNKYAYN